MSPNRSYSRGDELGVVPSRFGHHVGGAPNLGAKVVDDRSLLLAAAQADGKGVGPGSPALGPRSIRRPLAVRVGLMEWKVFCESL